MWQQFQDARFEYVVSAGCGDIGRRLIGRLELGRRGIIGQFVIE